MKHLHTGSPVLRLLVVAAFAVIITGACGPGPAPGGDTAGTAGSTPSPTPTPLPGPSPIAACAISSDSVRRLTRRQFVTWASRVEYDDSTADSTGRAHGSGIPGIRVHRMRGMDRVTRPDIEDGCLIARVHTNTAYPALGLGRGWTYVWADSTNPYTATMVPEQEGVAVTEFRLSLESGEPAPGTIASPRYICSDCGNDWCVYPRDTFSSEPALFSPGE